MKKLLSFILAGVMVLSLASCGGEKKDAETANEDTRVQVVIRQEKEEGAFNDEIQVNHPKNEAKIGKTVFADTLNDALMLVKSGKATEFLTSAPTALYVAARDGELEGESAPSEFPTTTLHIVALPDSEELINNINTAITAMKEDGTMDKLYADYVAAVIENGEPVDTVEMPVFEGAETITIGISGDLPPIDYVDTNGEPVGFNVAVIAEIANRLKINVKTEIVAAGTRFMALESKRIDAFFWETMSEGKDSAYALSEAYVEIPGGLVTKK